MATMIKQKGLLRERKKSSIVYPLQPTIMLIVGILTCLPIWLISIEGTWTYLVFLAILAWTGSLYSLAILNHALHGDDTPPSVLVYLSRTSLPLINFHALLAIALAIGLPYLYQNIGTMTALVAGSSVNFIWPGMVMLLILTRSIHHACNPIEIVDLLLKLKLNYFYLIGFTFLLEAVLISSYMLNTSLFWPVKFQIIVFISVYALVAIYYRMGMLLYQQQTNLNYAALEELNPPSTVHPAMVELQEYLALQKHDQAKYVLEQTLKMEPLNIEFHEHYHQFCLLIDDHKNLELHGHQYLRILLNQKKLHKATEVYQTILRRQPAFRLKDLKLVLQLAIAFKQEKKFKAIVNLLKDAHIHYPKHPLIPKVYGYLAKVLFEEFGQDIEAEKHLEYIIEHFPNNSLIHAIEIELAHIRQFRQNRPT